MGIYWQKLGHGRTNSPVDLARLIAVVQGSIWFILLIHGGWGLVFGPLAWLAVLIGARLPLIAAGLLLAPVVWLLASWAPVLLDDADAGDWLVVASLVIPALIAAAIFLRPGLRLSGPRHRRS